MKSVVISRQARADLGEIADFIATDNPKRAVGVVSEPQSRCQSLARHSRQGRSAPDIAPDVRILVFRAYIILHRVHDDRVLIDRVLHGARDRSQTWSHE